MPRQAGSCRSCRTLAAHSVRMREEFVIVYHEGTVTSLVRSGEHSSSVFGGPLEVEVRGSRLPKPLHHIATVSLNHLKVLGPPHYVWEIPLVYGLVYSGCSVRYRLEGGSIELSSGQLGEPTEDWPYRAYPELLPYVPLEVGSTSKETWEQFAMRAPNLPEVAPSTIVMLVPPPVTLGFSMWGRSGDAEGVTLVFECDLETKTVASYNVCG